jgi:hypothetical protein
MSLNFPNPSRSFDARSNSVSFWGYDEAIEVSFKVDADALLKLCPEGDNTKSGLLAAFDSVRKIHKTASAVHVRAGKGTYAYFLTEKDF